MNFSIFVFLFCFCFSSVSIAQLNEEQSTDSNEIKITVIRKGRFTGSANKWKIWLNSEVLCKLKNSSYYETTVAVDSLCLIGTAVGLAKINWLNLALEKRRLFCFKNLERSEYFFKVKMGKRSLEFVMIEEEEAKKMLKRVKRKITD